MQQTNIFSLTSRLFVAFLLVMSISGCQSGQKKADKDVSIEDFLSDDQIFDDIDKAKKIIYSLPSPLETAMIIKSAGAEYDQELLNALGNVNKYTTNKALALNLGIYTTDLSFASLFEQTQTSIDYMNAAKSMAEGLDITDVIDDENMKKLEDNLSNRDVVMDIISETFLNSSADLKESQRQDVAAVVLVGGWIEGLYIASELIGEKSIDNNKLVDRVLEQKLSFTIVQRLLEDNKTKASGEQNADIVDLIASLDGLKTAFDKVIVETSKSVVEGQNEAGVAQVSSKTTVNVKPEDFRILQSEIKKLRTSFIQ
jgi:hypothetical protein